MVTAMARKTPPAAPAEKAPTNEPFALSLRISPATVAALDAIADRENAANPWPKVTRSDLIRRALDEFVKRNGPR